MILLKPMGNSQPQPIFGPIRIEGMPKTTAGDESQWIDAITKQIKDYRSQHNIIDEAIILRGDAYSVKIDFNLRRETADEEYRFESIDCDNLAKPVLDALEKAGVWIDDKVVHSLTVTKYPLPAGNARFIHDVHERKSLV